jgi:hypothetical protein
MNIFELRDHIFHSGDEIPYVEFLYPPVIEFVKYRVEHPVYNVGETFPEGGDGELLVPKPNNAMFVCITPGHWKIYLIDGNMPRYLHYPSATTLNQTGE